MNQHTPGPWRAERYTPSGYDIVGPQGEDLGFMNESDGADEPKFYSVEANAHLVAAAPELLEAAKVVTDWYFDDLSPGQGLEKMRSLRAAIAKAEGKP